MQPALAHVPVVLVFSLALSSLVPVSAHADELADLGRMVASRPEDPAVREAYARLALARGRTEEALVALKEGLARIPDFRRGLYLIAVTHRTRGEHVEAAAYYRACIAVGQDPVDALYGLGRALLALGQNDQAQVALREYIARERDPAKQRFVESARGELDRLAKAPPPIAPTIAPDLLPPDDSDRRRRPVPPPDLLAPSDLPSRARSGAASSTGPRDPDAPMDPFGAAARAAPPSRPPRLRDLHDPFGPPRDRDDLLPPVEDPFEGRSSAAGIPPALRGYARAMAALRRALARHAEEVAARYDRGISLAIEGRYRDAAAAWDGLDLDDGAVARARREVERARPRGK